ncbi:MAG: glycosyl transferase [Legionellales bacterium]|nr:glycosyl transferase [Legionellales bacterium]|tara:strand:- start:154 stop:1101 length:948 start_codon:yes stop_codon:yes gene_type:complete
MKKNDNLISGVYRIAVLLPCFNEEATVANVVKDFKRYIPEALIYVYDNNSSDNTIREAKEAGAIVRCEPSRGKGNVVRRMFADIEADIFIMSDGDGTYDISTSPALVQQLIDEQLDMIVGIRVPEEGAHRKGHSFGNFIFNKIILFIFEDRYTDVFSGYRIFSKRFVKTFPTLSKGFEVETEICIHALDLNIPLKEVPVRYSKRVIGSESKLRTFSDGFLILRTIINMFKEVKPFTFFNIISAILMITAFFISYPLVITWIETGLVPRIPTAIIVMGLVVLSFICLTCGLILDCVARGRKEAKRLCYLTFPIVSK